MEGNNWFLFHLFSTDGSVLECFRHQPELAATEHLQADYNENQAGFHLLLGEKIQKGKKLTHRCIS